MAIGGLVVAKKYADFYMARDALAMWLDYLMDEGEDIPKYF